MTRLSSTDFSVTGVAATPSDHEDEEVDVAEVHPAGPAPRRTLAEKINYLFTVVRAEDDREYSGREVVASLRAAGDDMSASLLSELRRGVKVNPTMRVLEGLARFFGVRVAYFLDDPQVEDEVETELELRRAMKDAEVRAIAARVAGLDPAQRGAMNRLLVDLLRARSGAGGESGP